MLDELIDKLMELRSKIDSIDFETLTEEQRAQRLEELAKQVLNTLDNAEIKVPEEYQNDGGEQA